MDHKSRLALLVTLIACIASPVAACPFCNSSTGEQMRAGIFNADFVYHLAVCFALFPVLIAVLILIYYGPMHRPPDPRTGQLQSAEVSRPTSE